MRPHLLSILVILTAAGVAQQPQASPTPKKNPFEGFGSSLDKKPGRPGAMPPQSPPGARPPAAIPEPVAVAPAPGAGGIALATDWDKHVTQATGGNTRVIGDLSALLSAYGTSERDMAAHPDVTLYEGPMMDNPAASCRIAYLTPLGAAEKALMVRRGLVSHSRAVMPGFPDGLFLHTYDIRFGHYNRLTLVTDGAKPEPQVVALQLKNEHENWHPTHWTEVRRDWHTYDYLNTRTRGQPGIAIHTRVNDMRKSGRYIIVNMAFGIPPPVPPVWIQVAYRPNETSTWYIPEPLIKLALYCISLRNADPPAK